jgi:hypothetical protein
MAGLRLLILGGVLTLISLPVSLFGFHYLDWFWEWRWEYSGIFLLGLGLLLAGFWLSRNAE